MATTRKTTTTRKTSRKTPVDRRIRIGDQLVPYDDATQEVQLQRAIVDVLKAKPGDHQNCMNSQCIKAQRNRRIFPHHVWAVSTIKSRVYIIDEIGLKGDKVVFEHAVRYQLPERESALIHDHDDAAAGEPGKLRLAIPSTPKGAMKQKRNGGFADGGGHGNNPGKQSTGARNKPVTAGLGATPKGSAKPKGKPKGKTAASAARGAKARYKVAVGALN